MGTKGGGIDGDILQLCKSVIDILEGAVNSLPTIRNSLRKQNPVLKYNA